MAKKRMSGRKQRRQKQAATPSQSDEVRAAADKVQQARDVLREAETAYQQAELQASQAPAAKTDVTLGRFLDGTLELVRRFPVAGVIAAGTIGFLLGRSGRGR